MCVFFCFFFFKQKTAYEMRISDWSSDVCSSDLLDLLNALVGAPLDAGTAHFQPSSLQVTTVDVGNPTTNLIPAQATAGFNVRFNDTWTGASLDAALRQRLDSAGSRYELTASVSGESFLTAPGALSEMLISARSEEHTSELQSLMRISYAVFCLKKKKNTH